MADPFFWETTLLLPLEGATGSTTFVGYSFIKTYSLLARGNAALSTDQSKFGSASLSLDGSASGSCLHLSYASGGSTVLDVKTGDWTLECWVRVTDFAIKRYLFGARRLFDGQPAPSVYFTTAGVLTLDDSQSGVTTPRIIDASASAIETWYHIAICRVAGILRLFKDGVQVGSSYAQPSNCSMSDLFIGSSLANPGMNATDKFRGYIDEIKLTVGVGRYLANFTPPGAYDLGQLAIVPSALTCTLPLLKLGVSPLSFTALPPIAKLYDAIHGGKGRIVGTVKEAGTPDHAVNRRVRLHRKIDGMLIRETWSASDGTYMFENIIIQPYYVVAFDHTGNYNGVIKDSIVPELMP